MAALISISGLDMCREWEDSSDEENVPMVPQSSVKKMPVALPIRTFQDKRPQSFNNDFGKHVETKGTANEAYKNPFDKTSVESGKPIPDKPVKSCNETAGSHRNRFDQSTGDANGDRDSKEDRTMAGDDTANSNPPQPIYIPATPSDLEADIFGQEIASGVNFDKYAHIPVNVTGNDLVPPMHSFVACELSPLLAENIGKSGYTNPTPIQQHAIPTILNGRDLMGCAQTGSGKTASFLVPIVQKLLADGRPMEMGRPHVVIVTPTRELGIQIFHEARKFAFGTFVKCCVIYGGVAVRHQADQVRRGCQILVATPGRLLDFVEKNIVRFDDVRFLVLDEADRMLDMGFLESMKNIIENDSMPKKSNRQTLMFSATFPASIQNLATAFLEDYVFIAVGIIGSACSDVLQTIIEVNQYEKRDRLVELINEDDDGIMVFVETKRQADFLASYLSEMTVPTTSLHGDRFQEQREKALSDFRANRMKVLICTSVAARGLDIKNVKHVINYELPDDIDEYVHRIGRTGRIGNQGRATSFFNPDGDRAIASALVKILHQADQEVPAFLINVGDVGPAGNGPADRPRRNMFGGRDVRKDREFKSREPQPQEPEEDW